MTAQMTETTQARKTIQDLYNDPPFLSTLEQDILDVLVKLKGYDGAVALVNALPPDGYGSTLSDSLLRAETFLWLSYYQLTNIHDQIPWLEWKEEEARSQTLCDEMYCFMYAFVELRDRLKVKPPFVWPVEEEEAYYQEYLARCAATETDMMATDTTESL